MDKEPQRFKDVGADTSTHVLPVAHQHELQRRSKEGSDIDDAKRHSVQLDPWMLEKGIGRQRTMNTDSQERNGDDMGTLAEPLFPKIQPGHWPEEDSNIRINQERKPPAGPAETLDTITTLNREESSYELSPLNEPLPNKEPIKETLPLNAGPDTDRGQDEPNEENEPSPPSLSTISLPKSLTSRLYTSHFLSTWNSRLFEMGAVLFLAAIFPNTLLPMSVYALVRSGAAIVFAPAVGAWIDRGNRLKVVRVSIVGQRVAVAVSCGLFWVLERRSDARGRLRMGLFALVTALACVEKLCAVMNLVAVERDWVVVITDGNEFVRRVLNARMRRIDLFCKLLGPLAISLINGASTLIAIWVTLGMSATSVLIEYALIARVYAVVPALQRSPTSHDPEGVNSNTSSTAPRPPSASPRPLCDKALSYLRSTLTRILPLKSLPFYLHHPAFLPSFSLSLLYLTVLSFSGQMITFLLSAGYTSIHVGVARTVSTIFELSATWIAPRLTNRIGAVRGGIWFLTWQMAWLAGGVSWFFANSQTHGDTKEKVFTVSGLVGGVILSRMGLWGFDLCAQTIIQDAVSSSTRGAFSTVEASFQNLFELLSYVSTIIFSRPDQFQWAAVLSVGAVHVTGGLYTAYVRRNRGHLLHVPACLQPKIR